MQMFAVILLLLYFGSAAVLAQGVTKKPRYEDNFKDKFVEWLLFGYTGCGSTGCPNDSVSHEYEGYDGFYNNIGKPELGSVDTPLLRRTPAAYRDGVYEPSGFNRPSPIELSQSLLHGPVGSKSKTGKNAFIVFFGQQVVEEILDAQRAACPPEYFNLKIPKGHHYRTDTSHTELPLLRTRYDARTGFSPNNPRQQLNEITPYIDGGLVYGTTKAWSDVLRTNSKGEFDENGCLATSHDGLFPDLNTVRLPMANPPPPANHSEFIKKHSTREVDRFFKLGNPRGNENAYLLTFGVLWFRWHNHVAKGLRKTHTDWSSEKLYNEARRWVIGTQQHIIVNEWLPAWLGKKHKLPDYKGYDPSVDPQIDQFFQAAAFRFGHTLVPPAVQTRWFRDNGKCKLENIVRTCNSFWRPQEIFQELGQGDESTMGIGMEKLILGMTTQLCEEEDHKIVEDLRGNVFGPLEFSRRDLMAINIQRARDHGLPDFNTVREFYNLSKVNNLDHFNINDAVRENFTKLYGKDKFDDIDLWVGGIMETDTGPGDLFRAIIIDQFMRIRDGDRFWYKNKQNGLFTNVEIERIENTKFLDILLSVTNLSATDVPENPFGVPIEGHDDDLRKKCKDVFSTERCFILTEDVPRYSRCYHASADINKVNKIPCTKAGTYDYFSTSDASFIGTFVGLGFFIIGITALLIWLINRRQKQCLANCEKSTKRLRASIKSPNKNMKIHTANEWTSRNKPERLVLVVLNTKTKRIEIKDPSGTVIRALDLTHNPLTKIFITTDHNYVLIRVEHNYDLVLKFASDYIKDQFLMDLEEFGEPIDMCKECIRTSNTAAMMKHVVTKKHRQQKLEKFFKVVIAEGFKKTGSKSKENMNGVMRADSKFDKDVVYMELTITEFADVLRMSPKAEFVKKMFDLADKDKNGFISFREFMDMSVLFFKGTPDEKIDLMFNMYDIKREGKLSRENFADMLRSFMDIVNENVESDKLDEAIEMMMEAAGMPADQEFIDLEGFRYLLKDYKNNLSMDLNTPGSSTNKKTQARRAVVESMYGDPRELQIRVQGENKNRQEEYINNEAGVVEEKTKETYWYPITKYIANKQLEIFWVFLYTVVLLAIFAERAYYYQVEREHSGLRQIAGPGVTITRGAASAIMFTYSTLLVTMCQNAITTLRDTFLHVYIPFDSSLQMHKYVAFWALVFTVIHVFGHAVNFYHIATQTSDDLTCLFPNFFHATHEIPKFGYWCWQTITGVTGIALTILAAIMFTFALPIIRRKLYNWFWFTHSMYPLFYILLILHGCGRLVQEPFMYLFFSGPVVLFTLDKIIAASRKTVEIKISKAECLPSGVTYLVFKKPPNFQHKSGQWIKISCTQFNKNEYHPFTISSAPNEPFLAVHIRAVGPWTQELRNRVDPGLRSQSLLTLRVDGPYGEGAQDWYKYDVAIMIGGGIGVTPFSSILKDIVYKSNMNQSVGCKKVYFLWATRNQTQFEWMIDILRELEAADQKNVVSSHIFITQFYQKFDLRTILLYICERYFQRVSNKSMFTGLTAITHFERPDFLKFFRAICQLNNTTNKVGVFSCGPRAMMQAVDRSCHALNREMIDTSTLFKHHYKNF